MEVGGWRLEVEVEVEGEGGLKVVAAEVRRCQIMLVVHLLTSLFAFFCLLDLTSQI